MAEPVIWGIHGGKTGDADSLFLNRDCIALGWHQMGDLKPLKPDREAFKQRLIEIYPGKKPGAIPVDAGQLFRFVYEAQNGDLVVYPSKRDRRFHIGKITGEYRFVADAETTYPNRRPVKWMKAIDRTEFSQGALYETGSSMSFFRIKDYGDEFRAALEQGQVKSPVAVDESVAPVAEQIEENTKDFILKTLAQELKGHPFADFIAHLLNAMGYRTRVSPEGPDGGIDIIAHKDELGFEPPFIKVQVKSKEGSVGDPDVAALYGKLTTNDFALFFALGTFTSSAKTFARGKSNIRLIDGEELVSLILNHYEQFDSRYKGLLPLRKVFVPEPIEDEN